MPRGDRTGPIGMGAKTGRSGGFCAGFGMPGFANPLPWRSYPGGFGRGRGAGWSGFGSGRGWRNRFFATGFPGWLSFGRYTPPYGYRAPYQKADPELEKRELKSQADALESELQFIKKRLSDLETASSKD
jgi:hypothetical protein